MGFRVRFRVRVRATVRVRVMELLIHQVVAGAKVHTGSFGLG